MGWIELNHPWPYRRIMEEENQNHELKDDRPIGGNFAICGCVPIDMTYCNLHAAASALYDEVVKARDTFSSLALVLPIFGREKLGRACLIAKESADRVLELVTIEPSEK